VIYSGRAFCSPVRDGRDSVSPPEYPSRVADAVSGEAITYCPGCYCNGRSMDAERIGWRRFAPVLMLLAVIAVLLSWAVMTGGAANGDAPDLTPAAALLLFVIGLVAGVFGGLVGVGGSTIMLPIMYFYLGFPEPIAIGTGLFVVIFTSFSGAYGHLIRRNLDRRVTLWVAAGGLAGVLLGSWFFILLLDQMRLLGLILGIVFLTPSLNMIREGIRQDSGSACSGECIGGTPASLLAFGFGVGVLTGITGLGGGFALVPGLLYIFGAPIYITMGTSLAAMLPMAIVGGGIKAVQGFVALEAGLILAGGSIIGAQVGAAVIWRFRPATLKLIFGLYFVYVAIRFIAEFFGIALP
jgi:uncharacterized protein